MKSGTSIRSLTRAKVLSEEQAERVFQAALEVLERTGARVETNEALKLLKSGGAIVDGERVRIPREAVKASLESAPKKLAIHGRDGASVLRLGEGNTYYAPGLTCSNVLDPFTSERRTFGRRDTAMMGLLSDALPNIDYVVGGGIIGEVTPTLASAYEFAELAANTTKPLFGWAHDEVVLEDIYQMACAIAGGEEAFRERPNLLFLVTPVSPLVCSSDTSKRLLMAAKYSIPIVVWSSVLAGGSTPITLAGSLVVALAEVLTGLVLHQSRQPGGSFIFAGSISPLDMKRGITVRSPLRPLANIALNDILQYLGVLGLLSVSVNNSKALDQQASLEAAYSLLATSLAGPDLMAGIGSIEMGMTYSPGLLVLSDDIVGICKRVRRGLVVDEDTLAVDVVDRVGPGGHFLMEDHTLRHFKEEHWEPSLLDLSKYEDWDGRTLGERVKKRIEDILSDHKPKPMPDKVLAAFEDILQRAEAREASK